MPEVRPAAGDRQAALRSPLGLGTSPPSSLTSRTEPSGIRVEYLRHPFREGARGGIRIADYLFDACSSPDKILLDVPNPQVQYLAFAARYLLGQSTGRPRVGGPGRRVLLLSSLSDVPLALVLKSLSPRTLVVGPLYHLFPSGLAEAPILRKLGTRVVHRFLAHLAATRFDVIHTETTFVRDWVHERSPRARVVVGSAGVPRNRLPDLTRLLPGRDRPIDGLFLAALTPAKGIKEVLQAWKVLTSERPEVQLVLAGYATPDEARKVHTMVLASGLKNVTVLPNISEEEKYRLLATSKVHLITSMAEGVPFTFFEALAYGAQVVAFELPSYSDVRNEMRTVRLFDVNGLAQAVDGALRGIQSHWEDSTRRRHEFARQHCFEDVLDRIASEICADIHALNSLSSARP